jgi:hypothetical protein
MKWRPHVEAESHSVPDSLLSSQLTGTESELKDGVAMRDKEGKLASPSVTLPGIKSREN